MTIEAEVVSYDPVLTVRRKGFMRPTAGKRIHFALDMLPKAFKAPVVEASRAINRAKKQGAGPAEFAALKDEVKALVIGQRFSFELKPGNPFFADTLGWILVQQEQVAKGLPFLEKAATGAPKRPEIRFHLAYALVQAGQTERARQEIERLQEMKLSPELEQQVRQLLKSIS